MRTLKNAPAPTSYNLPGLFSSEHHDFNRAHNSSMFQKPIAERPLSPKVLIPAPNQYNVNRNYLLYESCFLSL